MCGCGVAYVGGWCGVCGEWEVVRCNGGSGVTGRRPARVVEWQEVEWRLGVLVVVLLLVRQTVAWRVGSTAPSSRWWESCGAHLGASLGLVAVYKTPVLRGFHSKMTFFLPFPSCT